MIFDLIFDISKYLELKYLGRLIKCNRELYSNLQKKYREKYDEYLRKVGIYAINYNIFCILAGGGCGCEYPSLTYF